MSKSKVFPIIGKIIWMIGLIVLSIISVDILQYFKQVSSESFNLQPTLWANVIVSFIFGMYLSIILVKKWAIEIKWTLLLCITVPCLLISNIYPLLSVSSSFGKSGSFIPIWLLEISSINIFGIVAGLTLILGIFTYKK